MDYGPAYETYAGRRIGLFGGKFFPPHSGHVKMALEASREVDVLFVVVQDDEVHEAGLIQHTNFAPVSQKLRERWLTEIFKDNPKIRVLSFYETRVVDYETNPLLVEEYKELQNLIGEVSVVFSGEPEYTPYFRHVLPHAEIRVLEKDPRISATWIREDLYSKWDFLPDPVRRYYQKRIVFCGTESAGKSFTSAHIGRELGFEVLPEYGRTYFESLGGYGDIEVEHDFLRIASGHIQQLQHAVVDIPVLILDTDLIYTQYFYREAYGRLNPALDVLIRSEIDKADLYLFLEPDVFDDDGSRFRISETQRWKNSEKLFELYEFYGRRPVRLSGTREQRMARARFESKALLD